MSAKSRAKSTRNPPNVRLYAHAAQIRIIARHAPMPAGTRNRLHAIAHGIDEVVDVMAGKIRSPRIRWTRADAEQTLQHMAAQAAEDQQ